MRALWIFTGVTLNQWDVIIIGAGAAGLMAAVVAGQRGRSVLLLERANKAGKKILMSGGGRCNFTNLYVEPEHFLSANPHFCKSALSCYSQWDFIELVNRHGIPYHEKSLGQLFCDNSSRDILDMLLAEAEQVGVVLKTGSDIREVTSDEKFRVATTQGELQADSLVVACGGPPWGVPTSATGWRGNSAIVSSRCGQHWCPSPLPTALNCCRRNSPVCQCPSVCRRVESRFWKICSLPIEASAVRRCCRFPVTGGRNKW